MTYATTPSRDRAAHEREEREHSASQPGRASGHWQSLPQPPEASARSVRVLAIYVRTFLSGTLASGNSSNVSARLQISERREDASYAICRIWTPSAHKPLRVSTHVYQAYRKPTRLPLNTLATPGAGYCSSDRMAAVKPISRRPSPTRALKASASSSSPSCPI